MIGGRVTLIANVTSRYQLSPKLVRFAQRSGLMNTLKQRFESDQYPREAERLTKCHAKMGVTGQCLVQPCRHQNMQTRSTGSIKYLTLQHHVSFISGMGTLKQSFSHLSLARCCLQGTWVVASMLQAVYMPCTFILSYMFLYTSCIGKQCVALYCIRWYCKYCIVFFAIVS